MKAKHKNYQPHSFGEFFEQTDVQDLQHEIKTTEEIKYSLVHSYKIADTIVKNEYFHLDKNYNVLGQISYDRMMEMTMSLLMTSSIFDKLKTDTTSSKTETSAGELDMVEGIANMMAERYKDAIANFTSAIKSESINPAIYFYRGQCYEKIKKKNLACEDFKNSKKLGYVDIELDEKLKACK